MPRSLWQRGPRALVAALLFLSGATAAPAQSRTAPRGFIWSVERDGKTSWLVGSLHVLTPDAHPLPAAMEKAFVRAKTLVEETDVSDLTSPELMGVVMTKGLFTNGESLQTVLPPATYTQFSQRMAAIGLPLEMVKMMRPWMAHITLSGLELQRAGFDPELGIDVHYRRKAAENGMALSMLETPGEQIDYLSSLPLAVQVEQLTKTLDGTDAELKEIHEITAAWRAGDAATIEKLVVQGMKEAPAFHKSLLVDRNRRWMPGLESCISAGSCFVVVGAAHMVGSDGLIAMLRQKGYKITQQ